MNEHRRSLRTSKFWRSDDGHSRNDDSGVKKSSGSGSTAPALMLTAMLADTPAAAAGAPDLAAPAPAPAAGAGGTASSWGDQARGEEGKKEKNAEKKILE